MGAAIEINELIFPPDRPENRPIASVIADWPEPKMLEANRLPRSLKGDPPPGAAKAGFDVRLERAPEVFAGFVIRVKI